MLSVLDIILISLGGLCVIIYAFFKIRQTIRYNKEFKKYIEEGKTKIEAKELCDSLYSKKKKATETKDDDIFVE